MWKRILSVLLVVVFAAVMPMLLGCEEPSTSKVRRKVTYEGPVGEPKPKVE